MRTLCVFLLCLTVPTALATHNFFNRMPMYPQPLTSSGHIQRPRSRPMYQFRRRKFRKDLPNIIFLKHLMELDCLKEIFNEGRPKNRGRFSTNEPPHPMSQLVISDNFRLNPYSNHKMSEFPRKPAPTENMQPWQFSGSIRAPELASGNFQTLTGATVEKSKQNKAYHSEKDENANKKEGEISHGADNAMEGFRENRKSHGEGKKKVEESGGKEETKKKKKGGGSEGTEVKKETEETEEENEDNFNEFSTTDSSQIDDYFFPMMVSFDDDKKFSKFSQQPAGRSTTTLSNPEVSYQYKWQTKEPLGNRSYEMEEIFEGNVSVDVKKQNGDDGLEFRGEKIFEIENKERDSEEEVKITVAVEKEKEKIPEPMIDNSISKILRGLISPMNKFIPPVEGVEATTEKKTTLPKKVSSPKTKQPSPHPHPDVLNHHNTNKKVSQDDVPKHQGSRNRNKLPLKFQPTTKATGSHFDFTPSNSSKVTNRRTTQTRREKPSTKPSAFLKTMYKFHVTEDPSRKTTTKVQALTDPRTKTTPPFSLKTNSDSSLLKNSTDPKHNEISSPSPVFLVTQRVTKTTREPKLSSFFKIFRNSTKSETKEEVVTTPKLSSARNLLTPQPSTLLPKPTTPLKNDSHFTPQINVKNGTTPSKTTPNFIANVTSTTTTKPKPTEKFVLQEAAWKNSRKMHFQETNKTSEHRRSDILITDNLKEYNENRVSALSYIEKLKKNNSRLFVNPFSNSTFQSIIPLIPIVINDLRDNKITSEDNQLLSEYFGKYWPHILALSNNTHLDVLPLIKMKDEKDLVNLLQSYVLEGSTATTTKKPADYVYDYDYDYMDDYKNMYQDILGQESESGDEKKRLRVKRNDEEDLKKTLEAMREYFESLEQEQNNDYIFKDMYDNEVEDVDLELIKITNLQDNVTAR